MIHNPFFSKKKKTPAYDIIVVGSGSGMQIVEKAINRGLRTALIDKGPAGGTCLNLGCIPSKMLTAVADRVMEIRESQKFGIQSEIKAIDFEQVMGDMRAAVMPDGQRIHENLKADQLVDYYEGTGEFAADYQLLVNDTGLQGKSIFIAAGARPKIPDIEGIDTVEYLTSETLLGLKQAPKRLAIIGGGYIAAEYGHFFSAMGSEVTIVQKADRLVPKEEPEISEALREAYAERMTVYTGMTVQKVDKEDGAHRITAIDDQSGKTTDIFCDQVLIAVGRRSNADLLKVEKSGIDVDPKGFIITDNRLHTSKENIWAFGDVTGKAMFTHVANEEASLAWHNFENDHQKSFDYFPTPHAVFSFPQIASVGLTEEAAQKNHDILVGTARYGDVAKGMALREQKGFIKTVVDKKNYRILGFHVFGPHAAILIQEVVNTMALGGELAYLAGGMHIHPALSEIVLKPFNNLTPA